METPQDIPTRMDRIIRGWTNLWFGILLGFSACGFWMERWHPNDWTRSLIYRCLYPATALFWAVPETLLAIFRGMRKHARLEAEMASRQEFKPADQPPASDPKSI
jgi:hypothetical protein